MSEKKPLGALQGCSQRGTGRGRGQQSGGVGVVGEHSWWYTATPLQVQVLITLTKHDIKSKRNLELNTRFLMMGKYQLVSLIKAEKKLWLKPARATHLPTETTKTIHLHSVLSAALHSNQKLQPHNFRLKSLKSLELHVYIWQSSRNINVWRGRGAALISFFRRSFISAAGGWRGVWMFGETNGECKHTDRLQHHVRANIVTHCKAAVLAQ